ncbi:MAG TPA: cell wall-binding repeat-containing protein [Acidimicrobiales bacterium]|nr:cell wall-binding repeat-containing protein [Acidimicrobiales bacterium]
MTSRLARLTGAAAATVVVVGGAGAAYATTSVTATRLSGTNRYGTAAAIAAATFPGGTSTVVIASGTNFPDALAASYATGRAHAPILLTDPNNLSTETQQAITNLKATGAEIVGGTAAVSANVASQLQAMGLTVTRVYGADRYATAANIAQSYPSTFVSSYGTGGPTALVASGAAFPDALAGGVMSNKNSFPMLLTDPNNLSAPTQSALSSLGIKQVFILGGTGAVSANVASQITGMGITVTRISGADRTQTATAIATFENANLGYSLGHVNLARGDDFADALAGTAHAGAETAPILLTEDPNTLGSYTTSWLQTNSASINTIDVFGGTAAISDATKNAAVTAAQ